MEPVVDPLWYRVAQLKPRLRPRVKVQRRHTRGRTWFVLCDDARQTYFRLDAQAYEFVGRLNGDSTVDEAWNATHERIGDQAPTQGETLRILLQLSDAEAIWLDGLGDVATLLKRKRASSRLKEGVANPLSIKVRLFDPTPLLNRLSPIASVAFSPYAGLVWLLLLVYAGTVAAIDASEIARGLALNALSPAFLLQMWLFYPLVKVLHEASHALAVRRWGGAVRDCGLNIVLLTPLPYVNASAANGFRSRLPRMIVGMAGVMTEMAIAAIALLVWSATNSPSLQQASLAIVAGCGVSTLIFNANPLARFDGYYILSDFLDMPNLAVRGNRMVAYGFERLLGGVRDQPSPEESRREAAIATAYALLAWVYQLAVIYGLAHWLYDTHPNVASAVGLVGTMLLLRRPVAHALSHVLLDLRLSGRRLRAVCVLGGATLGLSVLLFVVPVPSFTVQQGLVWAPSESILRANVPGELQALLAGQGEMVPAGQLLAKLDNVDLRSQRSAVWSRLQQVEVRYYETLLTNPLEAKRLELEREAVQAQLRRLDEQLDSMLIIAPVSGRLTVPRDNLQPNHYFTQGQELAYVLPEKPQTLVKVALTEAQAALARQSTLNVTIRLSRQGEVVPAGRVTRETPHAVRELPTALLSATHGGPVPTDPADATGLRTLWPVHVVEVVIDDLPSPALGSKAWVRFDHKSEPLGVQWYRAVSQAFLARMGFSP